MSQIIQDCYLASVQAVESVSVISPPTLSDRLDLRACFLDADEVRAPFIHETPSFYGVYQGCEGLLHVADFQTKQMAEDFIDLLEKYRKK